VTIPPSGPGRRPASGLDPMPPRHPPDDVPAHELPDEVPDPTAPGLPPRRPEVPTPGRTTLVVTGRDDTRHHLAEVAWGDAVDPQGLRALCGAAVETAVPGLRAEQADCPDCRSRSTPARSPA
jgi:hypothetical protein